MATSRVRMDWRTGPAEPTARPIPPPEERPTSLIAAERYTSTDFARRELEGVFMHSWHLVGRDQDIPDVGDYMEFELGDQSVLILRADEDVVKAYHNVCLHRGMQLRKGCGTAAELRCGYHSWCWHLDGSIKEVTDPSWTVVDRPIGCRLCGSACPGRTPEGDLGVDGDRDADRPRRPL